MQANKEIERLETLESIPRELPEAVEDDDLSLPPSETNDKTLQ